MKIQIKNLSKKYDDFLAVDKISLDVIENKITGFIGNNGAGKSTTINMILKLIYPSNGEIFLNDKKISFVPSEPSFYDNLTSKEIFDFSLKVTDCNNEKLDFLIKYFELDISKKVSSLSLGNKKKLALILALIKKYDVLVLDEATSGLDPLMQSKLFNYLLKEKDAGKTIFLSSHNLSEVEKYCDYVSVIKDGKIVDFINMNERENNHVFNVKYILKNQEEKSFVTKNLNKTIKEISKFDIEFLEINPKNISEEFLSYYEEEKK